MTQDMNYRSAILGSYSENHWNHKEIEHGNGLKIWTLFKSKSMM